MHAGPCMRTMTRTGPYCFFAAVSYKSKTALVIFFINIVLQVKCVVSDAPAAAVT